MPFGAQLRTRLMHTWMAILVAGAGCDIDRLHVTQETSCTPPKQTQDAYLSCRDDMSCPPGTGCLDPATNTGCEGRKKCLCESLYFPSSDANVLIKKFDTSEFDLSDGQPPGTFQFDAPAGAVRVICGFVVADPEISSERITNASKSLYGTHAFTISSSSTSSVQTFSFRLSDLDQREKSWRCDGVSFPVPPGSTNYMTVTSLRVGCWAYDRVHVIAATRLHDVDVNTLPEVQPVVRECAADNGLDGRLCLPTPSSGHCHASVCIKDSASPAPSSSVVAPNTAALHPDGGENMPLLSCSVPTEGQVCQAGRDFHVGRCVGSRCADQHVTDIRLPLVIPDCSMPGATDWLNCFSPSVQGYGSCVSGTCGLRCVVDDDCGAVAQLLGRDSLSKYVCVKSAPDGSCSRKKDASYVGVCLDEAGAQACP